MVYAPHPVITMCAGTLLFSEDTPGMLPRTASFTPDPSPFWRPPLPPSPQPQGHRRSWLLRHLLQAAHAAGAESGGTVGMTPALARGLAAGGGSPEGGVTGAAAGPGAQAGGLSEAEQAALDAASSHGARLGDVTAVAVGGDGSLWALYR